MNKINISNIELFKTINAHSQIVTAFLLLHDKRFASCSSDTTIKVYNSTSFSIDLNIIGHQSPIFYLSQLDNGILVSSSEDRSARLWEISKHTYKCLHVITDPNLGQVFQMIPISDNRMASFADDNIIKIWRSEAPYELIKMLKEDKRDITQIYYFKKRDYLFSGAFVAFSIGLWNLKTYQCDTVFEDVQCFFNNSIMEIDDRRIAIFSIQAIYIIDTVHFTIEQISVKSEISSLLSLALLRNGDLLFGCENGNMFIYDKDRKEIGQCRRAYKSKIVAMLSIDEHTIVSAFDDYAIRVWKY